MISRITGLVLAALLSSPVSAADVEAYTRGTFASVKEAHVGRALVVHFWSVTCLPCLVEMPRLAELVRERKDFDLVLVSTDPIEQTDRISSRLIRFGFADAKAFAFADGFEERLRYEADRTWRGELPFTVLVTASGTVTSLVGSLETAKLVDWLGTAHGALR